MSRDSHGTSFGVGSACLPALESCERLRVGASPENYSSYTKAILHQDFKHEFCLAQVPYGKHGERSEK